ncbi:MAG TPA: NlpC/P60 family protein [Pseudonocardia sp.]|nr:NlpC/P60 family protein [Pseudonocardia sp.]
MGNLVRGCGRLVVLLSVLLALVVGSVPLQAAIAAPNPPPNPSDDDLQRSRDAVGQRAGEVGRLSSQLAELDARTDDLQAALAAQRESAEAALLDLQAARDAAAAAAQRAADARIETEAASTAIENARARLDEFLTATYQQQLDSGPLALLTEATSPDDLVARAEFDDAVARNQLTVQDGLERARVDKANADSAARAALAEATRREAEANAAKVTADQAVATADAAARESAAQLRAVDLQRAEVQRLLDAAAAADSGLRAQRARFDEWQRQLAAQQAAQERAARDGAIARESGRGGVGGGVQRAIDRALSQVGVQYVWGGGNGRGPSTGIPDAFGSPLNRVGFDCSGLMLYAFNAVGVALPRVSRNQFDIGRKVPISDLKPGDMVFYRNGGAPIHHVAMYIGGGRMVEAPYTGADVRVVPLRTRGLLPQATRVL